MSVDAILKEIEALNADERAELKARFAELDPVLDPIPELSPELKAELDRRVADANANPNAGIPWEVVYAESMKRVRK